MPDVGVVALGLSAIAPNPTEWIANTDGAEWITVENRCACPIDVAPSLSDGSRDLVYGFTVPALYRSTVPILPDRGVLLSAMQPTPTNGNTALPFPYGVVSNASGNNVGRTVGKNNVPYMLHNYGGAPSEPLYPVESLIASVDSFTISAGSNAVRYVSYLPTGAGGNLICTGPVDMCLVAQTIQVYAVNIASANTDLVLQYVYDRDAVFPTPQLEFGAIPVFPNLGAVTEITTDARGAVGYALGIGGGAAGDSVSVNVISWVGSPGA